jgi:hypothetical protein
LTAVSRLEARTASGGKPNLSATFTASSNPPRTCLRVAYRDYSCESPLGAIASQRGDVIRTDLSRQQPRYAVDLTLPNLSSCLWRGV